MKNDNNEEITAWVCPKCHKTTTDYPALSRKDDKTEICSDCATEEAMADLS